MSHELAYLQLKPVSQIHLLVEDQEEGCMPQMGRENFGRSLLPI